MAHNVIVDNETRPRPVCVISLTGLQRPLCYDACFPAQNTEVGRVGSDPISQQSAKSFLKRYLVTSCSAPGHVMTRRLSVIPTKTKLVHFQLHQQHEFDRLPAACLLVSSACRQRHVNHPQLVVHIDRHRIGQCETASLAPDIHLKNATARVQRSTCVALNPVRIGNNLRSSSILTIR